MENFTIAKTSQLDEHQKIELFNLWNAEYPAKLSYKTSIEFDNYLLSLTKISHFLLFNNSLKICGWAFSFERDAEKWFAIILSETIQGKGFGRKLINKLKAEASELNGWVIDHNKDKKLNNKPYISPLAFYQKCNFEVLKHQRLELEKISAIKIKWMKESS